MKADDYSYENLKNLKYIDMLQKEVTRYYGPDVGLFTREATKDHSFGGVMVQKGTYLNIQPKGNHYNEKYFRNPTEFRPERWESECDDLPPFVFGGFSAGGRSCIGKHLAMIESKIALIKFLKRYSEIVLTKPDFRLERWLSYQP